MSDHASSPNSEGPRSTPKDRRVCEDCWVLVGERRGRVWHARRTGRRRGRSAEVEFDAGWVLKREETRGDVVGFLHTHPNAKSRPSRRDAQTMRAWVSCFGQPLLCLIDGTDGLWGYRFDDEDSQGQPLMLVESFRRGIVIGVEADGGQISS